MVAEQIRTLIGKTAGTKADFTVERPGKPEHGDFASNVALVEAKQSGKNPKELAEELRDKLEADPMFTNVVVAGPGFLNFFLTPDVWQQQLADILRQKEVFGAHKKTGQKVQVEFISANPTGPLTLGNGRGGFGGDVLANVLARAGHTVEREYYINDVGGQINTLGASVLGKKEKGQELYQGKYIEELRQAIPLSKQSAKEVGEAAAAILEKDIRKTVKQMKIGFDVWFAESKELHQPGEVERVIADLTKAGECYEKDGALWLKTSAHGDDKDRVLRKANGELTYLAADLAYHWHKLVKRQFGEVINIWGADHHGYVARLKVGVELLRSVEHFKGNLTILITQLVRLVEKGREVKMSKRAGTYVTLDELLDEVDVDVARFFFVMKSFDTHMDFDLGLAKEHSQKNPVYYLKYAHARIAGILAKAGKGDAKADLSLLKEPAELSLIKELAEFPRVITQIADDYQIQRLPHYALQVADSFHKFYEQCPVVSDDKDLQAARLKLVGGTKIVLQNIGDTLGITMPEKM